MKIIDTIGRILITIILIAITLQVNAQYGKSTVWSHHSDAYYRLKNSQIVCVSLPGQTETVIARNENLKAIGKSIQTIEKLSVSNNETMFLLFTDTKKEFNNTMSGNYWLYRAKDSSLVQIGKSLPPASIMFAKFSPDSKHIAYVSGNNLYMENLTTDHTIKKLTTNGSKKLYNGRFDWVYEQEFDCRDGFRWSPDSKKIAYWQIDAGDVKDYLMLNNTDSIYPETVSVTTPIAGEHPSKCRIGVIDIAAYHNKWMNITTDTGLRSYIPRMEWTPDSKELIVQHLNRRQNISSLLLCNAGSGLTKTIYTERDTAWINIQSAWDDNYKMGGWDWLEQGKSFLWASEKDGWRQLYRVSHDGKTEKLLTTGQYDVMGVEAVDENEGYVYFMASPDNATQAYLYRTKLDGSGNAVLVSPVNQAGTHIYDISPGSKYARHVFSNYLTFFTSEFITLPDHKGLNGASLVNKAVGKSDKSKANIVYFKVKTAQGIEMDAWKVMPAKFDSTKKYPLVFFVYTGPAAQTVIDSYGATQNYVYNGNMAADGYIYVSVDNRGTPAPKGAAWRKAVYRKMGRLDIADQAAAAREICKWPYVDTSRVAVWGWSNGGAATLNLLFQYPDIYKTGIAIAPITNYLYYDNIWMEHVMGLPQYNTKEYLAGSPITYAKNLKGNLFLTHGSGDDNVHYKHSELLINELIADNKVFQFMEFPNRSHNIIEGTGTRKSLMTMFTAYLKEHCPGGPR